MAHYIWTSPTINRNALSRHLSSARVLSEPMRTLAQTAEEDYYTRAANDDCIKGGPRTRTKYGYDARGRVVSASDALGHREYEYAGRMMRRPAGGGNMPIWEMFLIAAIVIGAIYYFTKRK